MTPTPPTKYNLVRSLLKHMKQLSMVSLFVVGSFVAKPALSIPAPAPHLEEIGQKFIRAYSYDSEENLNKISDFKSFVGQVVKEDSEPVVRRITIIVHTNPLKTQKEVLKVSDAVAEKVRILLAKQNISPNLMSVLYVGSTEAEKCAPKDTRCLNNNKVVQIMLEYTRLEYRRWPNDKFDLPEPRPAPIPLFSIPEIPAIP